MAGIVAFLYILSQIIYLVWGNKTRAWGGFAYISLLLALAIFMYLPKPRKAIEKDFVNFAIGLTLVRALYTFLCVFADMSWIYEKTDYFTIGVIATFIGFLIYSSKTHKRF